jgi:hypothetical protein
LIRNPDTKQMLCVICEKYVLTEEEQKAALAEKLKNEPLKEVTPSIAQQQPTIEEPSSEPVLESNLSHSTISTRIQQEVKQCQQ